MTAHITAVTNTQDIVFDSDQHQHIHRTSIQLNRQLLVQKVFCR